jgi:hypothetical protein
MRNQRGHRNGRARARVDALDRLVVVPVRATELAHRAQIQNVRRRDLIVAHVAEHRDDDREGGQIEREERVAALRPKEPAQEGNETREAHGHRERRGEAPSIAPQLLPDARHHRRADERCAVIEVRAVTREDVRLSAERECRAREEQQPRPPFEPRAARHREVDERAPERGSEDGPPRVDRAVAATEMDDVVVASLEVDRELHDARQQHERHEDEEAPPPVTLHVSGLRLVLPAFVRCRIRGARGLGDRFDLGNVAQRCCHRNALVYRVFAPRRVKLCRVRGSLLERFTA